MYARNVSIDLKPSTAAEFTRTLENDVLPIMRKQAGFKDELTFVTGDGKQAVAISLWDQKEQAETYGRDSYATVLKSLVNVVEGTPRVQSYEVSNSTFHKIAARS